MKVSTRLVCSTLGSLMLGSVSFSSLASEAFVQEISHADMAGLAQDASKDNKHVMILYYENNCAACDDLNQLHNTGSVTAKRLQQDFALYKTNVNGGFNVTCPNGEYLNDRHYMSIKGIEKLPALVITDRAGNVVFVENDVSNKDQLLALGDKYRQRHLAHSW